jgi:hypothetical protein
MDTFRPFTFFAIVLFLAQRTTADVGRRKVLAEDHVRGIIGAIVDNSTRFGKEQKVAMEMATKDVYDKTGSSCDLRLITSQTEPYQTALAGIYVGSFSQLSHTLSSSPFLHNYCMPRFTETNYIYPTKSPSIFIIFMIKQSRIVEDTNFWHDICSLPI